MPKPQLKSYHIICVHTQKYTLQKLTVEIYCMHFLIHFSSVDVSCYQDLLEGKMDNVSFQKELDIHTGITMCMSAISF